MDGQEVILDFFIKKDDIVEKHKFKKRFGQNFLNNESILNEISTCFDVKKNGIIVEVGAGAGALTKHLVLRNLPVVSFEIDESLKKFLDQIKYDRLKVIYKDFLEINLKDYFKEKVPLYFVANVPYYITTPIITKFIEEDVIPEVMVLMVQKEVADRLSAKPKSSNYGAISVILNYFYNIEYMFTVSRNEFYPVPNVDSAIIKLSKRSVIKNVKNFNKYKKFVNDAFKQKRKTLRNNLKNYNLDIINNILNKYELNLNNRAEDVDYEIFVEIVNNL